MSSSGGATTIVAITSRAATEPDCWIHIVKFSQTSNATSVLATSGTQISIGFISNRITYSYDGTEIPNKDLKVLKYETFNGFKIDGCNYVGDNTKTEDCNQKSEIILFQVKFKDSSSPENYYSVGNVEITHDSMSNTLFVSSNVIKKLILTKIDDAWIPYVESISDGEGNNSISNGTNNNNINAKEALNYSTFLTTNCPVIFYLFCTDKLPPSIPPEYLKQLLNLMIIDVSQLVDEEGILEKIITSASDNLTKDIRKKITNLLSKIEEESNKKYNLPIAFVSALDYPKLISVVNSKKINDQLSIQCQKFAEFIKTDEKIKTYPGRFFQTMREYYETNSSHPWGFVKLNLIPNGDDMEPNQRLFVRTCEKDTILLIDSVFNNELMYVRDEGTKNMIINSEYVPNDEIDFVNGKFKKKVKNTSGKQIFGPFKNIYPHGTTNAEIAKDAEMQKILGIIKNPGGIAFAIGYGASGAGKTSSLVYFNKGKTEKERIGILIQMLNEMKDYATTITVYSTELCMNNTDYENCDEVEVIGNGIVFTWVKAETTGWNPWKEYKQGESFVPGYYTDSNATLEIKNPKRIELLSNLGDIPQEKVVYDSINRKYIINIARCSIGQVSQIIVDSNRHVAGTSNNPNSSRSHDIVKYVCNLKNNGGKSLLIVGDLAGSESKFACEVPSMVQAFANLKNDNDENGLTKYYFDDAKGVPAKRDDIADFTNDDKVCEMFGITGTPDLLNYAKVVFFYMTVLDFMKLKDYEQLALLNVANIALSNMPSMEKDKSFYNATTKSIKDCWENGKISTVVNKINVSNGNLTPPTIVQSCIDKFNALRLKSAPEADKTQVNDTVADVKKYVKTFEVNEGDKLMRDPNSLVPISSVHQNVKIAINTTHIQINKSSLNPVELINNSNEITFNPTDLQNELTYWRPLNFYTGIDQTILNKPPLNKTIFWIMDACFTTNSTSTTTFTFTFNQINEVIAKKPEKETLFICLFGVSAGTDIKKFESNKNMGTRIIGIIKIKKIPNKLDGTTQINYLIDYAPYFYNSSSSFSYPKTKFIAENFLYRTDITQTMYNYLTTNEIVKAINKTEKFAGDVIVTTQLKLISQTSNWSNWIEPPNLARNVEDPITKKGPFDCAITVTDEKLGTIKVPGSMRIDVNESGSKVTKSVRYLLEEHLIQKFGGQNNKEAVKIIEILKSYKFYVGIRDLVIKKCNLRSLEGAEINKALINLRPAIKLLYAVKNSNRATLPLSVLYGTDMFKKPLDQILFNMEITNESIVAGIEKSNILKSIFSFVIKQNIINFANAETDAQKYTKICQEMTVILMCVINISKMTEKKTKQDNLQYLSVNDLQIIYGDTDKNRGNITENTKLIEIKKSVISLIKGYYKKLDEEYTSTIKSGTKTICSTNQDVFQLKNLIGNPQYEISESGISFTPGKNSCDDKKFEKDLDNASNNTSSASASGGGASSSSSDSNNTSSAGGSIANIYEEKVTQEPEDGWSLLHVLMRIQITANDTTPEQKQKKVDHFISTFKLIIDAFDVFNSPTIIGTIKAMSELINGISTDLSQEDSHYKKVLAKMPVNNLTKNEIPSAT